MERKLEVPALTKDVVHFKEEQSGQDLLKLRPDNGTGYLNRELDDDLKHKTI